MRNFAAAFAAKEELDVTAERDRDAAIVRERAA